MAPKSILRPLGELLELFWQPGGLLEISWSALGALRDREKDPLRGSWALREESQDRFQLSWGPNLPIRSPGGSEMEPQRRLELKKAKSQTNAGHVRRKPYSEAPGPPQNRSRTDPKLVPNRIFDAEALEKPLESLLERSWRLLEPKKSSRSRSWAVLGRSWSQKTTQHKPGYHGTGSGRS